MVVIKRDTSSRNATVTVVGEGFVETFEVIQAGADPMLTLSEPEDSLASTVGSTINLNLSSNTNWTLSVDADWLSVSPDTGSGYYFITLTAAMENSGTVERSATLSAQGGGIVDSVIIVQLAGGEWDF